MPQLVGSMRPIAALVATAASTAFPPRFSTSNPTCAASGWLVATMPLFATVAERPAWPGRGVGRSAGRRSGVMASASTQADRQRVNMVGS